MPSRRLHRPQTPGFPVDLQSVLLRRAGNAAAASVQSSILEHHYGAKPQLLSLFRHSFSCFVAFYRQYRNKYVNMT